jgi:hypothetical protein
MYAFVIIAITLPKIALCTPSTEQCGGSGPMIAMILNAIVITLVLGAGGLLMLITCAFVLLDHQAYLRAFYGQGGQDKHDA